MNLAIRGIDNDLGPEPADSFRRDLHPDLKVDFIIANPPFNMSDWGQESLKDDVRWRYGVPPKGNANYAWIQHFIHHLGPSGIAGFVLANGSMSSNSSGEGEIRKALIEADLVDCMVALPGQLFYSTPISACLWFIAKNRHNHKFRDRHREILFIDARKMGSLADRTHMGLSDNEIATIASTYRKWLDPAKDTYRDQIGFSKSASLDEVASMGSILSPGRYVGTNSATNQDEDFEEKMQSLIQELGNELTESKKVEEEVIEALGRIGFIVKQ
jgi:type I restriction enzyme M protein